MHELSLIRTLLQQVNRIHECHPECRLSRINVSVGEFSGVDPELLRSAFEQTTERTSLEQAALLIERVTLTAKCRACGEEFGVEKFRFVCPACGSNRTDIVRGEELTLESVTFEEQEG